MSGHGGHLLSYLAVLSTGRKLQMFIYLQTFCFFSREHPMFFMFVQLAIISIFKAYPTVGDIALYMAFLPLWSHLYQCKSPTTLTSILTPSFSQPLGNNAAMATNSLLFQISFCGEDPLLIATKDIC